MEAYAKYLLSDNTDKIKKFGNFIYKIEGHPAQSLYVYSKKSSDNNNPNWTLLDSFSDH